MHAHGPGLQSAGRGKGRCSICGDMKKDYNIMLAGSFDCLAGKVIRIGHMGNNATAENVRETFHGLDGTFRKLGIPLQADMETVFMESLEAENR